jgi:MinD-like ATPase involved in chromosome partitioning or flagellar assembly
MNVFTPSNQQDTKATDIQAPALAPQIWTSLPSLPVDPHEMEQQRIVSFQRHHPAAQAFDIMRTKLLRSASTENWISLGITAPTSGCGKATVAVNLAISLAKLEKIRVGVVDLDLRQPRIAGIFAHSGRYSMAEFLRGECLVEDFFVRLDDNLAIGASPETLDHPAELLHSQSAADALTRMREELRADIIVYNLPALLESDDCLGLLPLMDTTLLVVGAEESTVADIDVSERELQEQSKFLGVVLNKCRYKSEHGTNFQV